MSPRTGRPTNNPRRINLNIRISEDESMLIQECADNLGLTRTDTIIKGVKLVKSEIDKKR